MAAKPTVPVAKDKRSKMIGSLFRRAREAKGITLRKLAEDMGCSVNTIRWHEAGHTLFRADQLKTAAHAMRVRVADLLVKRVGK